MFQKCLNQILDLIMPQVCYLCGQQSDHSAPICKQCLTYLPLHQASKSCSRCGAKLIKNACGCHITLPYLSYVKPVFNYEYPIIQLIHSAKYRDNLVMLRLLSEQMQKHIHFLDKPDCLIPVPSHPKKLKQRGYNQAVEMAKVISSYTNIPMLNYLCQCVKNIPPQASLNDIKARQKNVKGAFKVFPHKLSNKIKHVVIIDDIVTTGSTANEIAGELLLSLTSVKKVGVWCCAKA